MKKIFTLCFLLSIFGLSNALSQIPTEGLVGYWPFSGNANDESGNGHDGTLFGPILESDRFGRNDAAYYFDGVNDYIYITNSSLVEGGYVALSFWLKKDISESSGYPIITGNQNDYYIHCEGDSISCWIVTDQPHGGSPITGFETEYGYSPYNQWNHIVLNYDGNNLEMYINNVLSKSIPANGHIFTPQSDHLVFGIYFLGGSPSNQTTYYGGLLDDIRIYNRPLNNVEITNLYFEDVCITDITVTDTLIINANLTSFNPITYANTIKIYPNPTFDNITIDYGSNFITLSGYTINIVNSLSQTVYNSPVNQQIITIDLNSWTGNGIYFVHLIDANSNTIDIKKIVLQ